ncbi:BRO-N domain-containing protein [Pantoea agglomerans]|uniref:BRO-N domain-containing protein n=1 Tax=Enterobacter agglomerans TaxID=549 RepID=UPI0024132E4B|nr:BRO family protein [Pantoea agglomerans]
MSILAKSDLTFQNFTFNPVAENGQVWITSTELAKVLKYKKTDAISQIYARNSDEFTDAMTMTLNMRVNGINNSLRNKSVRIYSLRGCHLIAMFATTPVAKEFRRWVLDILDRESLGNSVSPIQEQIFNLSMTSREMCSIAWLFKAATHLREDAEALTEVLEPLNSPQVSALDVLAREYRGVLMDAKVVLSREIGANLSDEMKSVTWKGVLPTLGIH